jgi:hypothetical protein
MSNALERIAASIESNVLGRLMHGQRELFHSNLLAWFFDAMPDHADQVFQPMGEAGGGSARHVERERENLDLVMHWPGRVPLVIENKVFSSPRREQLDEYSAKVAKWPETPRTILLSPGRPSFDLGSWSHVNYGQLATAIKSSVASAKSDYEVETMRKYASLAADLDELVSTVDVTTMDEAVWLSDNFLSPIKSSQMRAALRKARASRIADLINHTLPDLESEAKGGMTSATPFVEALEHGIVDGFDVHLGWQLQGEQFRRAVSYWEEAMAARNAVTREGRERLSAQHPELFAFPSSLPQVHEGRSAFNHFAPGFVYQYVKVPNLTVNELLSLAKEIHQDVLRFIPEE